MNDSAETGLTRIDGLVSLYGHERRTMFDLRTLAICHAEDIVSDDQRRTELENDLRLAKEYWGQTIRPYFSEPITDLIQWYVADRHTGGSEGQPIRRGDGMQQTTDGSPRFLKTRFRATCATGKLRLCA